MSQLRIILLITTTFVTLISCAPSSPVTNQVNLSQTQINTQENACVGTIVENIPGLKAVDDPGLLAEAVAPSGKGGLCIGQVFEVEQEITVYRVWNKEKSYTQYGRWWSFDKPTGDRESYRRKNDICPSWSELNQVSHCFLKVGARIVVGPGQSAVCKKMTFPKSPVNQVFVPNDSRNNVLFVENCSEPNDWPYGDANVN